MEYQPGAVLYIKSPWSSSRLRWRERVGAYLPFIILIPSLIASFIYVFVFTGWTLYISLSNSSLLPSYEYVGFEHYASLWQNRRWNIAYTNLFVFGGDDRDFARQSKIRLLSPSS